MRTELPESDGRFSGTASPEDREKVLEFMRRKSVWRRWRPVAKEMRWVMLGRPQEAEHQKLLPEYCYEILAVYRRTVFKNYPTIEETLHFIDRERYFKSKATLGERRYGACLFLLVAVVFIAIELSNHFAPSFTTFLFDHATPLNLWLAFTVFMLLCFFGTDLWARYVSARVSGILAAIAWAILLVLVVCFQWL